MSRDFPIWNGRERFPAQFGPHGNRCATPPCLSRGDTLAFFSCLDGRTVLSGSSPGFKSAPGAQHPLKPWFTPAGCANKVSQRHRAVGSPTVLSGRGSRRTIAEERPLRPAETSRTSYATRLSPQSSPVSHGAWLATKNLSPGAAPTAAVSSPGFRPARTAASASGCP